MLNAGDALLMTVPNSFLVALLMFLSHEACKRFQQIEAVELLPYHNI